MEGELNLSEWKELIQDSKSRWKQNAEHWMIIWVKKVKSISPELIKPYTENLLSIKKGQTILDIACGNGNFSRRLVELGANVVAFAYSSKMVERAQERISPCTFEILIGCKIE